jgi:glycosyltransferase involved in cell wall biosynthesis
VVGDAGVYFDPTDVGSMAGVIGSFLSDGERRDAMAHQARERAALFTWEASARALVACFDELEHDANREPLVNKSA